MFILAQNLRAFHQESALHYMFIGICALVHTMNYGASEAEIRAGRRGSTTDFFV